MESVLVSIVCNAYNHEKYIADAIESFLNQKTNFSYEVLINDDASTDRTATIIKEYEAKYPSIIKPLYQNINQFSQGVRIGRINADRAKGKYIALCEGDDFWTDSNKLQTQVDFLESNPDFSLCVHAADVIDARTSIAKMRIFPSEISREFSTEEIISGGGGLFATNSMVYRTSLLLKKPDFYNNSPIGDYPLTIFLSLQGRVYYLNKIMSTYRQFVPGSWTETEYNDISKKVKHNNVIKEILNGVDEYTKYLYHDVIAKTLLENEFKMYVEISNFDELKNPRFHEIYEKLSLKNKVIIIAKRSFPSLLNVIKKIKKVFSNCQ